MLAATLVAAAGLCRMASGGIGGAAVGPLLGTVVVGFAVPALILRTRLGPPLAAVAGTLAVVVTAVWTSVLATKVGGPFASGALGSLPGELRDARVELATFHLPLHAGPGVVLIGAVTVGLAGMAGRFLLGPFRSALLRPRPAIALVPALALVTWSCIALPGTDAALLATAFVAAAAVVLAGGTAQRSVRRPPMPGSSTRRLLRHVSGAAFLIGLSAIAASLGIGIPLGTPGASTGVAEGSGTVPATTLSLTTGLVRVQRDDARVVLFRAHSPVPTYWQVAVLTVWRDGRWVPGPRTQAVLRGGSAPLSQARTPVNARRFTASVTIGSLSSRLLPVPTSTVDVTGLPATAVTTAGVLSPSSSTPGETYTATALTTTLGRLSEPVGAGGPLGGRASQGLTTSELAHYLELPAIPSAVANLARQVTATATSPLAQAEDLVDWFRSGHFHYTLTPPAAPVGVDPLVAFLTIGRAGSCESFSGAFAVMARTLGLPTRVAVGFTGGTPDASGSSVIVGGDAHAWPEVYLGATAGWVSFEPTPEQPSGGIAPADVIGPTVPAPTSPTTPITIPTPATSPPTPATSPPAAATTPATAPSIAQRRIRGVVGRGVDRWLPAPAALGLLLLAAVGWLVTRRRRLASEPPEQRVMAACRRTDRSLARSGMARPPGRTPTAHATALLEAATRSTSTNSTSIRDELLSALRDLEDLAQLVEQAGYSPRPLTPAQAAAAEDASARIMRTLRRTSVRAFIRALPALDTTPHSVAGTSR